MVFLHPTEVFTQSSQTAWKGTGPTWSSPANWDKGIPDSTRKTLVSLGTPTLFDPSVPAPDPDTARTNTLTIQSGGHLYFDTDGVLAVYGSQSMTNDGDIVLGSGTIIFKSKVGFTNGGTFHADSGMIRFEGGLWTNHHGSSFDPGTSTAAFDGSANQVFSVDTSIQFSFYNLQIFTHDTVFISGNITVQNDCYLAPWSTIDVAFGSSFTVNGSLTGGGTITGSGSYSSLPVELTAFRAVSDGMDAVLQWTTATEADNFGFDIERRAMDVDASLWSTIGFVGGYGTSTSQRNYSFVDRNLPAGRYAYRLKQLDKKGSSTYFSAAELTVGLTMKEFSLGRNYPNPFNPTTTIEFSVAMDGRATLEVFNLLGQRIAVLFDDLAKAGQRNRVTFDASAFSSGLYFYRLESGTQHLVRTMSLVR